MKANITQDRPVDIPQRRILVVASHETLSLSLKALLDKADDPMIVSEVTGLDEARRLLNQERFDLALVDRWLLSTSDHGSRPLFPEHPSLSVVLMTMDNEWLHMEQALAGGIRGLIAKQDIAEELLSALREVLAGRRYLSRELLHGLSQKERANLLTLEDDIQE